MNLSNQEIDDRLIDLGAELGRLETVFLKTLEDYETQKANYENDIDRAYLRLKANNPEATVRELEACSKSENHIKRLELVKAEASYKALKNKIDNISTKIGILQSVIKLRTAEIKSLN